MKGKRQKKILELIEKYDIETQEELTKRLMEKDFPPRREPFPEISGS